MALFDILFMTTQKIIETLRYGTGTTAMEYPEYRNAALQAADKLESLERENVMLANSLPLSTNRTRDDARKMLGPVERHSTGFTASHGCVEVGNAVKVVDLLIGDRESLAVENSLLRGLIQRAMEYGVNGARSYSSTEACRTGEDMRDILSNAVITESSPKKG